MKHSTLGRVILVLVLAQFSSCAFFSRPPALPRREAIEPTGSEEKFAKLLEDADIVYFPSEVADLESRSEAAWRLLEALRRGGGGFAIGWDWASNDNHRRRYLEEAGRAGGATLALNELKSQAGETGWSPEQAVADEIATYFREHRSDKMLVFLRRERLGMDHGVPYLVAQKTKARQLILNPRRHREQGPGLLARR
ncbi:MAG TPA: hypothetical protein VM940_02480 [Chthoniobacterales bacterium]|nr:hypothetical protein [Chthoniobacterales bacterium]